MNTSTALHALLLVALLVAAPVVGATVAADGMANETATQTATATPTATATATPSPSPSPSPSPTPTPEENDDSGSDSNGGWTLSDLKEGGTMVEPDAPSIRMTDTELYWVIYWPPGSGGGPTGDDWEYLSPDTTVKRNSVWMRTFEWEGDSVDATIVYWRPATRTVNTENGSTTERYASNVTVTHQTIDIPRGRPTMEIPLRRHDTPTKVLIELDNGVRWTFTHHSVATSQSANINTEGDYLRQAALDFLIVIAVGLFVGGWGVRKALKQAARGPGWGYLPWIIALTVGTLGLLWWSYSGIMAAVVANPWIVGVYLVLVAGIVMLETLDYGVKEVVFLQPKVTSAVSPRGDDESEDMYDMISMNYAKEKVVELPDGRVAMLKNGPIKFLARLFGSFAVLEGQDRVKTKVNVDEGSPNELIFVHPSATKFLDYDPEGFRLSFTKRNAKRAALATVLVAGLAGMLFAQAGAGTWNAMWGAPLGLMAGATMFLSPKEASATYWPAPTHMRSVLASVIMMKEGTEDAELFDQLVEQNAKQNLQPYKQAFGLMQSQAGAINEGLEDVYSDFQPDGTSPRERGTAADEDESDDEKERTEAAADD